MTKEIDIKHKGVRPEIDMGYVPFGDTMFRSLKDYQNIFFGHRQVDEFICKIMLNVITAEDRWHRDLPVITYETDKWIIRITRPCLLRKL